MTEARRVVVIIQARMGSTRLPGKVLIPIRGTPVIDWVFRRATAASTVGYVVVATSRQGRDDVLADYCRAKGWAVYRGSEKDVLDRYREAARAYDAEVVVRVTGDCPLVDPAVVDRIVEALRRGPAVDYASNILEPRTFPRGLDVEAFTTDALETAWTEDENPAWREHVTPYIYRNPDRFRLRRVTDDEDHSHLRLTLDTPEDLRLLRRVLERMSSLDGSWREAIDILEQNRDWLRLNSQVTQKEVE